MDVIKKEKTDNEKVLTTLAGLRTRIEDLFILQAACAGVKQDDIRAMLGIDKLRVVRIAKHVKDKK